jgi:hypothetical protein
MKNVIKTNRILNILLIVTFYSCTITSKHVKIENISGKYIIDDKRYPNLGLNLYLDSSYYYYYIGGAYSSRGKYSIDNGSLFLIDYFDCDTCENISLTSCKNRMLSVSSVDNINLDHGGMIYYIENGNEKESFFVTDADSIFINEDIKFDSLKIVFAGFKSLFIPKPQKNTLVQLQLVPTNYFSIGKQKWKIKKRKLISHEGKVFLKDSDYEKKYEKR